MNPIGISSVDHKHAALVFPKIFPMHSEGIVPRKYQQDLAIDPLFSVFSKTIEEITKSPLNEPKFTGTFFSTFRVFENYRKIFFGEDVDIPEYDSSSIESAHNKAMEILSIVHSKRHLPYWIRDVVTLIIYESALASGNDVVPLFSDPEIYKRYLLYGGMLPAQDDHIRNRFFHVIQDRYLQVIDDQNSWEQISEIRKDKKSQGISNQYHKLILGKEKFGGKTESLDKCEKIIEEYEEAVRKHGLKCRLVKRHLIIEASTAAAYGALGLYSVLSGGSTLIPLTAIIGASIATGKTIFTLAESNSEASMPDKKIATYMLAIEDAIGEHLGKPNRKWDAS